MRQPLSTQKKKLQLQQYKDSDDESAMDTVVEDLEPLAKRARVQPKVNTWACTKCTFENPNTSQHCGICASVKSSTDSNTTAAKEQTTAKATVPSTPVPLKELKESIAKVTLKTKATPAISKPVRPVSSRTSILQAKLPKPKISNAKPPISKSPTAKSPTKKTLAERQKSSRTKPKDAISKTTENSILDTKVSTNDTIDSNNSAKAKVKPTRSTTSTQSTATKNGKEISELTAKTTLTKTTSTKATTTKTTKPVPTKSTSAKDQSSQGKSETRPKRFFIAISGADVATRQTLQSSIQAIDNQCPNQLSSRIVDANVVMTHVIVTDASKRTMKMLFGIARGCWIVTDSWVFSSLEAGKWLPEKDFQVEAYSHHQCNQVQLLKDLVFTISLTSKLEPPKDVVQSLITAAGGKVSTNSSRANYCVCNEPNRRAQLASVPCVTPKWLFDSIAANKLQNPTHYLPGLGTVCLLVMDVNRIFSAEQIVVPLDLPLILKEWTKDVIRAAPADVVAYSLQWFQEKAAEALNGKLSVAEIENIRKLFEPYDVDMNGKMEARDLKSFVVHDLGLEVSDTELEAVVMLLDANNTGYLEFNDVLKWYSRQVA
ncbi:radial spoke protein 11 [Thraustotheca clavata]|uniref:Radial spoke protein 11 n=1 Tax=Thraustotheca clavata TaxID=74557 RepID=A0A1V9ZV61_9STRA|nr:radial spoke protein 11 [Thraustotheca clavata]